MQHSRSINLRIFGKDLLKNFQAEKKAVFAMTELYRYIVSDELNNELDHLKQPF